VYRKQNLKMNVKIKIDAEYFSEGSLLRGDRRAGVDTLTVNVSVDSDAPAEVVARVVKEAEAGCFTLGAIRHIHPVTVVGNLNGSTLELGDRQTP
jgi:hypothetical protein